MKASTRSSSTSRSAWDPSQCTGAFTSFKTTEYYSNVACGMNEVMKEAHDLGICYKLVDMEFCAQVHSDP